MLAGDVESNPGPPFTQTMATMHLTSLRTVLQRIDRHPGTHQDKLQQYRELQVKARQLLATLPPCSVTQLPTTWAHLRRDQSHLTWLDQYVGHLYEALPKALHNPPQDQQGLHYVHVDGDGNCFFRALAMHLYGQEDRHLQVRCYIALYDIGHRPQTYDVSRLDAVAREALRDTLALCTPGGMVATHYAAHAAELWQVKIITHWPAPDSLHV